MNAHNPSIKLGLSPRGWALHFRAIRWPITADDLVKEHSNAPIQAAMRAHTLLDQGDRAGYALWRRIGSMSNVILSKAAVINGLVS